MNKLNKIERLKQLKGQSIMVGIGANLIIKGTLTGIHEDPDQKGHYAIELEERVDLDLKSFWIEASEIKHFSYSSDAIKEGTERPCIKILKS